MFKKFKGKVRKQRDELSTLKKIVTLALRKKVGDEFLPRQMPQRPQSISGEEQQYNVKSNSFSCPKEKRILATVKDINILESLWKDMQDSIVDGKWHAFLEVDKIIARHRHRQPSMKRICEIRRAYFQFAKDDEYHAARGGKDYSFEQGDAELIDGVKKFRFIPFLPPPRIDYKLHGISERFPKEKR